MQKLRRASIPGLIDIGAGLIYLVFWGFQNSWWEPNNVLGNISFYAVVIGCLAIIVIGVYCLKMQNWKLGIGILDIAVGWCALFMGFPGLLYAKIVLVSLLVPLGILSIIGGIFCIKGRRWSVAMAGAIAALLSVVILPAGLAALILTAVWKKEFR
jgi:hypothetical protein